MNSLSKDHLNKLAQFWTQVAAYYRASSVVDETIKLYSLDCVDVSLDQMVVAFKIWRNDQQLGHKMPLPLDLKTILNPQRNPKDAANEAANNVLVAMQKWDPYGWDPRGTPLEKYSTFEDYVRVEFGELALLIISKVGGARKLRRQIDSSGPYEALRAQLRDLGLALYNTAEAGLQDAPPALPSSKSEQVNSLIESTIKKLPGAEK